MDKIKEDIFTIDYTKREQAHNIFFTEASTISNNCYKPFNYLLRFRTMVGG